MKVVLIPCGPTEWHDEGRLLGRVEVPLTARGEQRCDQWRAALAAQSIRKIFHSPDDLASRTAGLIGNPLGIPTKPLEELCEVDVGLWAGLTEKEMKTRYATAHRELCEAPLNVRPPSGEKLSDAVARLQTCLKKRVKPNGKSTIALVLRPFSFAIARCALQGEGFSSVWEAARSVSDPVVVECDGVPACSRSS